MATVAQHFEEDDANKSSSKIRVTFFESQRPLVVTDTPETDSPDWSAAAVAGNSKYVRQVSTESGRDNPFRPDGNLSREADEIVQLIKQSGKPVVLHEDHPDADDSSAAIPEEPATVSIFREDQAAPNGTNGTSSQVFEVQHAVVASPTDAATVEHVHIKKEKGCCVIQ